MVKSLFLMACLVALSSDDATAQSPSSESSSLSWSYLYDGGAIPFIYGSGLWAYISNVHISPPASPRLFSANEGGARFDGDTIPAWTVGLGTGVALAGLIATPSDARWYHVKGFLQASLTTSALTGSAKFVFGRHRPHYDASNDHDEDRRSFFSGHSSAAWSTLVYSGLYLRQHVFSRYRGSRVLPWWEALSYLSMAALGVYVPATRISDNRHHPSDVIVGGLAGASVATLFYAWQEKRYSSRSTEPRWTLGIHTSNRWGVTLSTSW